VGGSANSKELGAEQIENWITLFVLPGSRNRASAPLLHLPQLLEDLVEMNTVHHYSKVESTSSLQKN
jgi:hypothetical protein